MIELAPDGELIGIRFNNRSTAAITDVHYEDMAGVPPISSDCSAIEIML
jgi:hypothetical protein